MQFNKFKKLKFKQKIITKIIFLNNKKKEKKPHIKINLNKYINIFKN